MSVSPISIAVTPPAAASPTQPGVPQTLLPFMLLLPATAPDAVPIPPPESPLTEAEPVADDTDEAPPLIGWLFDSIALAGEAPDVQVPVQTAAAEALRAQRPRMEPPALQPAPVDDLPAPAMRAEPSELAAVTAQTMPTVTAVPDAFAELLQPAALQPAGPLPAAPAVGATPAPSVALPQPPVVVYADHATLGTELGERISWQLQQGIGEATIELHPAELGALTIRIETQAQQAQVHILAAEPAARALLSQCLPQLRDLLGASGLTLTRGQVEAGERRGTHHAGDGLPAPRTHRRVTSVTLVDAYV
jgi:flagellar hook-length control protein FliK